MVFHFPLRTNLQFQIFAYNEEILYRQIDALAKTALEADHPLHPHPPYYSTVSWSFFGSNKVE